MEIKDDSLECAQDIEKLLEGTRMKAIFTQMTLQIIIYRVNFRRTFRDALTGKIYY